MRVGSTHANQPMHDQSLDDSATRRPCSWQGSLCQAFYNDEPPTLNAGNVNSNPCSATTASFNVTPSPGRCESKTNTPPTSIASGGTVREDRHGTSPQADSQIVLRLCVTARGKRRRRRQQKHNTARTATAVVVPKYELATN